MLDAVRQQDLARLEPGDLGRETRTIGLADDEVAGRDVDRRQPVAPFGLREAAPGNGEEEVGTAGIEQAFLGDGAGRDQTHHVAADNGFGAPFLRLRGILHLLADRDPVAEADQALQVVVGAVDGHAAHGNVVSLMLAPFRQHDPEGAAGDLGIIEEQLVEIAHPVEQQAIRVGRLDLHVLRHHRRHAGVEGLRLDRGGVGVGGLWGLVEGLG